MLSRHAPPSPISAQRLAVASFAISLGILLGANLYINSLDSERSPMPVLEKILTWAAPSLLGIAILLRIYLRKAIGKRTGRSRQTTEFRSNIIPAAIATFVGGFAGLTSIVNGESKMALQIICAALVLLLLWTPLRESSPEHERNQEPLH
jgi:hypothetical protein